MRPIPATSGHVTCDTWRMVKKARENAVLFSNLSFFLPPAPPRPRLVGAASDVASLMLSADESGDVRSESVRDQVERA